MTDNIIYSVTDNDIHVQDSYMVSKHTIPHFIEELQTLYPLNDVLINRSTFSLSTEWFTHNLLYKLHIRQSRTKDVDLNYPQLWYEKILYPVIGIVAYPFIS